MPANIARDLVDFTLREVRPKLKKVCAAKQGMEFNRFFLRSIRDKLDDTCRRFERGDASEIYEDLYLPLFDALAYVNTGLGLSPIFEAPIREAAITLDGLHDHLLSAASCS